MFRSKAQGKNKVWIALDVFLTFIILYLSSVAIHEFFHANLANLFNLEGVIVKYTWFAGLTTFSGNITSTASMVIGFMGGGGVALFYYLIYLLDSDWETTLIAGLIGSLHLGYGCFEAFYLTTWIGQEGLIFGAIIGVIVFFFYWVELR